MKNFGANWLALAMVVGVGATTSLNGCGDGPTPSPIAGTTGTAGRGGTTGSAGSTAGTGGSTARGGTTGTAGRGGTTGSAGSTAGTGGGTAGTGVGGVGGTVGGLPCAGVGTFDTTDMMGFKFNGYMDPAAGAAVNLAVTEAGTQATLSYSATEGDPAPGSLKVEAPYTDYKQYVDIQKTYSATTLQTWTGYKLHVRVKVTGGNPSALNPMGVQPYVNTGMNYEGYCGKYNNLVTGGGWNDYVVDLSTCTAPADASKVIALGVSIQAGDGSNGDGGVNPMKPMMATIYIDSFWLEGSCGGTGGTGGGTAGTTGAAGTGGGSAGTTGTAGTTGAGGTGGGTAGTTGAAGTTGTAGTTGAGGTGGTAAALTVSNFDTTTDGFSLNTFMDAAAGADINLAVREAGAMATSAWDGSQGMGTPVGSIKVNAPFDAYKQYFDLTHNYGTTLQNWTGKTVLKVRFKVTAGGNPDPAFPAGAQAYVQTSTSYEGAFGYNNVAAGTDWQVASVTLPATMAGKPNWNLAQVQQVGIKIVSGSGTGADAAVASGPPTPATIYVDSVWVE